MIKESDLQNLIAKDKKELSNFILNFSGFTLTQAGYDPQSFPFYLQVAFRHQAILQSEFWDGICQKIEGGTPLSWIPESDELTQIANFSQSIVTEVVEASQDDWSLKLLKTSYFSILDRARKSSEDASKRLYAQKGQKIADLCLSRLELISEKTIYEETTQEFLNLLATERAYLDSLLALPFNLEKLCLRFAKNNVGANYQPKKTAEMLAKTLETINLVLKVKDGESYSRDLLISGLQFALDMQMPDFSFMDDHLVKLISYELVPFINQLIQNYQTFERAKEKLLPTHFPSLAEARKKILASMDVHLYSLNELLHKTLIKPVEQCNSLVLGSEGITNAAYQMVKRKNGLDKVVEIGILFKNFDNIASACSELDDGLLPSWLTQAKGYYNQLKNGASLVNAATQFALNGLGAFYNSPGFYNHLVFYLPQSIRYYLAKLDNLSKICYQIDNNIYNCDKAFPYFAFYELISQGKIFDPLLKENLFAIYMTEVAKVDPKLCWDEFKFEDYQELEEQLKQHKFNLKLELPKRIKLYTQACEEKPTKSASPTSKAKWITNPRILQLLVIINRLQTLESDFAISNSSLLFKELSEAEIAAKKNPLTEIQAIYTEFLQPAMQRLNSKYYKGRLTPFFELRLESIDNHSHKLRVIYSQIKEDLNLAPNDLSFLQSYFIAIPKDFESGEYNIVEEILDYVDFAKSLPPSNKKLQNPNWKTAKEIRDEASAQTLENAKFLINPLFNKLQENLDEQNLKLKPIETIKLAKQKIAYIEALNGLINNLRKELNTPQSQLQKQIIKLLNREVIDLTKVQFVNPFSLKDLAGKLMNFAYAVLPLGPESDLFYNVLEYSLRDFKSLHQVIEAENNYRICLNKNPIPALMTQLNDPLAEVNLIPSQEKIMDTIVANLVESGKQQAFSWGLNYLKELINTISYQQLLRFVPYPFLADLALSAMSSQALQDHLAPVFNAMMNEYSEMVTGELKKLAKKRLYPILGIEIQKTIETCAYNYVLNSRKCRETDRDAFAMYYLQYYQIEKSSRSATPESTIRFLFPKLLESASTQEENQIISNIHKALSLLNQKLDYDRLFRKYDAIEESDQLLQFIIEKIDFEESANSTLIKLALVNRLLIMSLDSSEQLQDEEKISKLQIQAINRLSDAIKRLNDFARLTNGINNFALNETALLPVEELSPDLMFSSISTAQKRLKKQQFKRLKSASEKTQDLVYNELIQLKAMRDSEEPLLGLSILERDYQKSSLGRKIVISLSKILAIVGPILTWLSIIGGLTEGFLVALGIAVGLGASVTGIGLAIFFAGALCCLAWNFSLSIYDELFNLILISEENASFWERAEKISLIVIKCLGKALLQTILIDYLLKILKNLFAAEPFAELIDAITFWPTEQRVHSEIGLLESLQGALATLESLIDEQINFVDLKINPDTQIPYLDQSRSISNTVAGLRVNLEAVEALIFKTNSYDARFKERNYQTILDDLNEQFGKLNTEINRLIDLENSESYLEIDSPEKRIVQIYEVVDSSLPNQNKKEDLAILVNLENYKKSIQKQSNSRVSNFFSWFQPKPKEVQESPRSEKPNVLTLSGETLVLSILDGIAASTAEKMETMEDCKISQESSRPTQELKPV